MRPPGEVTAQGSANNVLRGLLCMCTGVNCTLIERMNVRTGDTKFIGLISVKIFANIWVSFIAIFTFTVFLSADLFQGQFLFFIFLNFFILFFF